MKVLSDFDGVLTDLAEEAARTRALFQQALQRLPTFPKNELAPLLDFAAAEMIRLPHQHGWRVNGRVSAFSNEDGFIWVNGLGACLDQLADSKQIAYVRLRNALQKTDVTNFCELAKNSYYQMVKETTAGVRKPLDPIVPQVFGHLLKAGHDIVVVSNSGTDRIVALFRSAGLACTSFPERRTGTVCVRGNAGKFLLGTQSDGFAVQSYFVETDRPQYAKILSEEMPDIVIGDVFSLDLALPVTMAARGVLKKPRVLLRVRPYTPKWSLEYVTHFKSEEVTCGTIDSIGKLLELA